MRCRCGNFQPIPDDGGLILLARGALEEGRTADARRYLLAQDERSVQWHYLMGECCFREADYPQARSHFHRCEDAFDVRSRLEICCREMEDYKMAYFYARQ